MTPDLFGALNLAVTLLRQEARNLEMYENRAGTDTEKSRARQAKYREAAELIEEFAFGKFKP